MCFSVHLRSCETNYTKVNYLDSYREQLSIAFDAYLEILRRVQEKVDHALSRDTPNWRIKHACPCCGYVVDGLFMIAAYLLIVFVVER